MWPEQTPVELASSTSPTVEPVQTPAEHDLSQFNSCFKCGREEAGNVKLMVVGNEKRCAVCVNS